VEIRVEYTVWTVSDIHVAIDLRELVYLMNEDSINLISYSHSTTEKIFGQEDINYFNLFAGSVEELCELYYRAVVITSRKHVTKHFCVAKKYCAQWQLKGSRCLAHNLCAIFVGFTQRDNCTIATVNIIKA